MAMINREPAQLACAFISFRSLARGAQPLLGIVQTIIVLKREAKLLEVFMRTGTERVALAIGHFVGFATLWRSRNVTIEKRNFPFPVARAYRAFAVYWHDVLAVV